MKIEKTVSIISGGASGLGRATALSIVRSGGRVAIIDVDQTEIKGLAAELGNKSICYVADVTKSNELDSAVSEIKKEFGSIHNVINCAGVGGSIKIVGKDGVLPVEKFDRTVQINLIGCFNMIRATIPTLMENRPNEDGECGLYVNTSSIAAFDGQSGQSAYSASKGGIVSMTLTLAREFATNGIRVMTILPGTFDTPLLAKNPPKVLERLAKQIPFPPRLGRPEEFASLVCHIIENPYLNGECIRLDGGLRMGFIRK